MKKGLKLFFICVVALAVMAVVLTSNVMARQATGEVRGVVRDSERGEALIGAVVILEGTSLGAATNLEGVYSIKNVPAGQYSVTVRFVGYRRQSKDVTVSASATATVDFSLSVSAVQMDEVVVTGQGSAIEKRKLSSPVETINAKEVSTAPVTTIQELVQGRVPGMTSFTNSGQPGTAGRIRSRGVRSAFASQTPVIYVDGVRVDNQDNYRLYRGTGGSVTSSIADITVGAVERVEIIKGGAASTLYGSDAAGGVIQIFTKKGVAGTPKWTFSTTQGFDNPEKRWVLEDFTKDKMLKSSAPFQGYTANVTGGSEVATYNVTGRMQLADGIQPKNNSRLYAISGGFRSSLGEKMSTEFSASFSNSLYGANYNNNAIASPYTASEVRDIQATPNPDSTLDVALSPDLKEVVNRFTSGLTTRYNPYDILGLKFTVGMDYRKNEQRNFNPIKSAVWTSTPGGGLFRFDRDYLQISLDFATTLSYPKEGDITSTLTAGIQGFREEDRQSTATGTNFPVPGTDDFDNASTIQATEDNRQLFNGGFYVADNFGIFNRIFLDVGLRVDGNSAFGKDAGLQSYPKAGIAYNISDESFWPLSEYVNSFKLRASIGQTGKFPTAFTRDRTFSSASYLGVAGIYFSAPGNQSLKPEKTTTTEFGFDMGLFNDRIGLQLTVYSEVTKDALFNVALEPSTGYATQTRNIGEIKNSGIEIALSAVPISTADLEWSFRFSLATLKNELASLGGSAPFAVGGFAFLNQRAEEGYPIGVFRVNVPAPLSSTGADQFNLLDADKSPLPTKTGSISTSITLFRDLRINALADYAYGGWVLNTGAVLRALRALSPQVDRIPTGYTFSTASVVFVEKADWLKMREISARYQLPSSIYENFNVRGLAVTFSIRNVFTITPVKEFDPELNGLRSGTQLDVGGIGYFPISPPRETRFGIEVSL